MQGLAAAFRAYRERVAIDKWTEEFVVTKKRPHWATDSDDWFWTSSETVAKDIPAGMYELVQGPNLPGLVFAKVPMRDDDLLRFPESPVAAVLDDIERFWTTADQFEKHGIPHKRGILLYGPPGSGKTCTVALLARDVVRRGGIVLSFGKLFMNGYRVIRRMDPERPVVCLMEDLDGIMKNVDQSAFLNLLDGTEALSRIVFVATTNYLHMLEPRLQNRPSRFDRKVFVDHPGEAARRMYLETLVREGDDVDLDKWAKDTHGFSLAHIKELFIGVFLLGNEYAVWLKQLREMMETSSEYTKKDGGGYA